MSNLIRWIIFSILVTVVLVAAQPEVAPSRDTYGLYSNFDPSMVVIVMVIVCAFFFVGFLSIYIFHCKEPFDVSTEASAVERSPPEGLDKAVIESLPVFIYSYVKDLKIGKGVLECAICLSEFEDDERLRFLPKCSHVFHPNCISAWLAYHVTCPVCRTKLEPDSDVKSVQSCSNITEFNSNNESSPPTSVEEQNAYVVIEVNEESRERKGKITAKYFQRSYSTGHLVIQPGENVERFTLRLPEEIRKQITKSEKLKRTRSYDVVFLGRELDEKEEQVVEGKGLDPRLSASSIMFVDSMQCGCGYSNGSIN